MSKLLFWSGKKITFRCIYVGNLVQSNESCGQLEQQKAGLASPWASGGFLMKWGEKKKKSEQKIIKGKKNHHQQQQQKLERSNLDGLLYVVSALKTSVPVTPLRISSSNFQTCVHIFVLLLFQFSKSTHSSGSQWGTYLVLLLLFFAATVALVRDTKTQPSTVGNGCWQGDNIRHIFCLLTVRTWTTSPWFTQMSLSVST